MQLLLMEQQTHYLKVWPSFDDVWETYDKKVGNKEKLIVKWNKLSQKDKVKIMEYIPLYKQAQPEKIYRKNFETFLNNKSWNDELIFKTQPKNELTLQQKILQGL